MSYQNKFASDKNFAESKSARIITDPGEIISVLEKANAEARSANMDDLMYPQTTLEKTDEGMKVIKTHSFAYEQKEQRIDLETVRRLAESRGVPWREEYVSRLVKYWASDERVDRHGDIVLQNWDFANYSKNNIMLYSHNWELPPIGAVIDWGVSAREDKDYEGKALYLLSLFALAEQWEWADTVFRLVVGGFLKSGSVGFYPGAIIDIKDQDEREELGLGRWGLIFDKNSLIEWSPTSVPANVGAHVVLNSMKSKNLLLPSDITVIREIGRSNIPRGENDISLWKEIDGKLKSMWKELYPEMKVEEHPNLDEPFISDPGIREEVLSEFLKAKKEEPEKLEEIKQEEGDLIESIKEAIDGLSTKLEKLEGKLDELNLSVTSTLAEMQTSIEAILEKKNLDLGGQQQEEVKPDEPIMDTSGLITLESELRKLREASTLERVLENLKRINTVLNKEL